METCTFATAVLVVVDPWTEVGAKQPETSSFLCHTWMKHCLHKQSSYGEVRLIVTSNSPAKWSRIFMYFLFLNHLNALKVTLSPSSLTESHGICSAAGAIYVSDTFTQSGGRLTMENSSAGAYGGTEHLGVPFWGSFEMLFDLALRLW